MEDSQQETPEKSPMQNEDSQDSHEDTQDAIVIKVNLYADVVCRNKRIERIFK